MRPWPMSPSTRRAAGWPQMDEICFRFEVSSGRKTYMYEESSYQPGAPQNARVTAWLITISSSEPQLPIEAAGARGREVNLA